MKKIFFIGILVMIFCLMAGQAGAADLQVRLFSVDGNTCQPGDLVDESAEEFVIEVSLVNWDYGTDVLFGVSTQMNLPTGQTLVTLDCNDIEYNVDVFSPALCSCGEATANEKYDISVASLDCAGNTVPLWLYRQKMIPTGYFGTLTIIAEVDAGVDYFITHAAAGCNAPFTEDRTGGDGILTLRFAGAVETRYIIPSIVTVNPTESVQFTVGGAHYCNAPRQLVFSDTCTHGDVDNATGLFTTVLTRYETCEVSVFDTAQPAACSQVGADCTAAVTIMSDCAADCNSDGRVNTTDLGIMKTEFFRTNCATVPCQSDITDDGKVNTTDLGIMKVQFFRTDCPTP